MGLEQVGERAQRVRADVGDGLFDPAILDHLVVRIVEVLPITSAGVTLIAPGAYPEYVSASDEDALRLPGFAASVSAVLVDTGTNPQALTVEVTESAFNLDHQRSLVVLNELKRTGVTVALDNFGCGNSSLSYLKRMPIDIVKIDRLFAADLERDAASRLIVSAIVGIAHGLRMTVVAEGVESSEQLQETDAVGCALARPRRTREVPNFHQAERCGKVAERS
ncbi:MAG: EAL domain-containing protein [Acidimicrobiia bacterium]